MEVVLDTVSLRRLTRGSGTAVTAIDAPLASGALRLVVDRGGSLIDEWRRTCGWEVVEVLVNQWEPHGAFVVIDKPRTLPYQARRRLNQLGFSDTVDKLIVRIACHAKDRTIVSDDSDFWDPDKSRKGDSRGAVATALREELELTVMVLATMVGACA